MRTDIAHEPTSPPREGAGGQPGWPVVALIALVAFQLRSVILSVPPVLPDLRSDMHLSFGAAGALTAIPVLGLGAAAVPGAILVSRFGARRIVTIATLGLGLGALLRLAPPEPAALFAWSVVFALCIAVIQPAMPSIARSWFPGRVQQVLTAYTGSLAIGGLIGSTASVFLLHLGGWRFTLTLWSVVALAAAVAWLIAAPGRGEPHEAVPHGLARLVRDRHVWLVALLFGSQSLVFYASVTWLPFLLRSYPPSYLALVLFLFQVTGPILFVALTVVRSPWARSRAWYFAGALLMTAGSIALAREMASTAWLWALILGVGGSMVFAGAMALPALLAPSPQDVAGYTALVLTAGNVLSFAGPFLGGVVVDVTHASGTPFAVNAVSSAACMGLALLLPRRRPESF